MSNYPKVEFMLPGCLNNKRPNTWPNNWRAIDQSLAMCGNVIKTALTTSPGTNAFLAIFLSVFLSSCSIFSSSSSAYLGLEDLEGLNQRSEWSIVEISPESEVYQAQHRNASGLKLYFTVLHSCGGKQATPESPHSIIRQLLVGFENIRYTRLPPLLLTPQLKLTRALTGASLEKTRLGLAHYSFVQGKCVLDLVLWNKGFSTDQLKAESSKLDQLAREIISNHTGEIL